MISNLAKSLGLDSHRPTFSTFHVTVDQSHLVVRAHSDLSRAARDALVTARHEIESYIKTNVAFDLSLEPLDEDPAAPALGRQMINAGRAAQVGPFAAVAGAIAQAVGRRIAETSPEVIVENGNDRYLILEKNVLVTVDAGLSPLVKEHGILMQPADTPCGLCTTSGTTGHAFNSGRADAVTVMAEDAALADAASTAIANLVQGPDDIETALQRASQIDGVLGAWVVVGDQMGVWGKLNLVSLKKDAD